MAITKANLIPGTLIPAITTLMYTVGARQKADVTKFTLVNTSVNPEMVNVYIARVGDTAGAHNQKAMNLNLESGRIYELGSARGVMNAGDQIYAGATTASVVALTVDANIIT